MRILAITDLHANRKTGRNNSYYTSPSVYFVELAKRAKTADCVVCSGDISVFGMELYDVLEAMNSWNKPVFLIHGNHEDSELLKGINKQYKNIQFIHGKEKIFNGISIFGWGGGGFATEDKKLERQAKKLKQKNARIILFHGPPYGTKLDWMVSLDEHRGNHSYTKVIEKLQPFLVVCGHIHENIGKHDTLGRTVIINPGPLGKIIELENK